MRKVLKFETKNCSACRLIEPFLVEIEMENDDIEIERVDAHLNMDLANEYGVMSAPVLVVLEDGKEVNRMSGYLKKEQILEGIRK